MIGVLLVVVSLLANFVKREALDPDQFRETSEALVADPAIQAQVANAMVETLYSSVDVSAALEQRLPPDLQSLAGPIAGLTREVADRAAGELLQRPRVQETWVGITSAAHDQFINVLEGDTRALETTDGNVVLDIRPLVIELGTRYQFVDDLAAKIPAEKARITIMESDQLGRRAGHHATPQGRRQLDLGARDPRLGRGRLARPRPAPARAARDRDRVRDRGARGRGHPCRGGQLHRRQPRGLRLGQAGRRERLVDHHREPRRVGVDRVHRRRPGAFGLWLAGPGRRATGLREELAPYLRRADVSYAVLVVLLLLFVWWSPIVELLNVVIIAVLALIGLEVLRRRTAREFPDAVTPDDLWDSLRARFR